MLLLSITVHNALDVCSDLELQCKASRNKSLTEANTLGQEVLSGQKDRCRPKNRKVAELPVTQVSCLQGG